MELSKIARVIAVALLLWAQADHPYGYFTLLRFVVCFTAAYCSVYAKSYKNEQWAWTFGAIAIFFNPIFPIYLTRNIWRVIDVIIAGLFIASFFSLRK